MSKSEMKQFLESRNKAKSYFCRLFDKNMPNKLETPSKEKIINTLLKIKSSIHNCESVYVLDQNGTQITPTYTSLEQTDDIGKDKSEQECYYRSIRNAQCDISDPQPSAQGGLFITVSKPIYDQNDDLKFIACLDMPLEEVIKISHLDIGELFFTYFFKASYAMFAIALMAIALLLFLKGAQSFFLHDITPDHFEIKYVFEATILLTLALAIFDLSKTLIEEEMLGWNKNNNIAGPHKTMVKFLGSIIIALSIEALMLVFKFAITDPDKLIYAMYIVAGVGLLIISLAIYIRFTKLKIEE